MTEIDWVLLNAIDRHRTLIKHYNFWSFGQQLNYKKKYPHYISYKILQICSIFKDKRTNKWTCLKTVLSLASTMEEVRTFRSLDQQNSLAILFIMIELGKKGVSLLTAKRLSKGSLHLESEATKISSRSGQILHLNCILPYWKVHLPLLLSFRL